MSRQRRKSAAVRRWMSWLEEQQAENILWFDLRGLSDLTDDAIIASGRNVRHLEHLSSEAMTWAKARGEGLYSADGLSGSGSGWRVLDFGPLMIHLFLPEIRVHYGLEEFWQKLAEGK